MNKPLLSIIIPAYNEEAVIADCLSSVCNQTFSPEKYEVIIINNASTDKTKQVAQNFNVKIIDEPKKGYVYALRTGCEKAQADIIAITDADTIVPNDWIEKIYNTYKKDSNIVAVGGGTILKPSFPFAKLAETFLNTTSPLFNYFIGYNFSVRKDIYRKSGGFRMDMNLNTDTEFSMRLRKYGKIVCLQNNPVTTSSRHYRGIAGLLYSAKSIINFLTLTVFNRTIFFNFKDIRDQ